MPQTLKRRESFRLGRASMGRFSCALHLLVISAGNIFSAHYGDDPSLIISIHHRQLPYVKHGHKTQSRVGVSSIVTVVTPPMALSLARKRR